MPFGTGARVRTTCFLDSSFSFSTWKTAVVDFCLGDGAGGAGASAFLGKLRVISTLRGETRAIWSGRQAGGSAKEGMAGLPGALAAGWAQASDGAGLAAAGARVALASLTPPNLLSHLG